MAERFKACAVAGCNGNAHWAANGRRGFCSPHVQKDRRYGNPLAGGRPKTPYGARWAWVRAHLNYEDDDCLIWPFSRSEGGYGLIRHKGRHTRVTRVFCEAIHGPPPTPLHEAAHSCGNGHLGCCNPRHLSWKTRKENAADAIAHGTWNHGERVPQHKLTAAQVLEVRALGTAMIQADIAARYGVSRKAIGLILRRKTWAWLS